MNWITIDEINQSGKQIKYDLNLDTVARISWGWDSETNPTRAIVEYGGGETRKWHVPRHLVPKLYAAVQSRFVSPIKLPRVHHTPECLREQGIARVERFAWILRWPGHCPICEGYGGFIAGADRNTGLLKVDTCADCTEQLLCPRCGESVFEDVVAGDEPCRRCGWSYDDALPVDFWSRVSGTCACEDPAAW